MLRIWDMLFLHGRVGLMKLSLALLRRAETLVANKPSFEMLMRGLNESLRCAFDADAVLAALVDCEVKTPQLPLAVVMPAVSASSQCEQSVRAVGASSQCEQSVRTVSASSRCEQSVPVAAVGGSGRWQRVVAAVSVASLDCVSTDR